jgi:hypothetical protein
VRGGSVLRLEIYANRASRSSLGQVVSDERIYLSPGIVPCNDERYTQGLQPNFLYAGRGPGLSLGYRMHLLSEEMRVYGDSSTCGGTDGTLTDTTAYL